MPHWNKTVSLAAEVAEWKSGETDIPKLAEKVADKLADSGWRELTPYPETFDQLLADLKASLDEQDYSNAFNEIYDLADSDRVWIETT